MRKKLNALEKELPSKVFTILLQNPKGMSGFDISKEIYKNKSSSTPNKIYEALKELDKEKLIIKKNSEDRKKKFLITLNYDTLVEVLNDRLDDKLIGEEKKEVKEILKHYGVVFKFDKLGISMFSGGTPNAESAFDITFTLLKVFSELVLSNDTFKDKRNMNKAIKLMGFEQYNNYLNEFMTSFLKCSDTTLKKLTTLPETPFYKQFKFIINVLTLQGNSIGIMLKNFMMRKR